MDYEIYDLTCKWQFDKLLFCILAPTVKAILRICNSISHTANCLWKITSNYLLGHSGFWTYTNICTMNRNSVICIYIPRNKSLREIILSDSTINSNYRLLMSVFKKACMKSLNPLIIYISTDISCFGSIVYRTVLYAICFTCNCVIY